MIIFLYGEDTYRSREKLKEITSRFAKEADPQGGGLVYIDGETASFRNVNEAVSAPSLFSGKRMIVIERIFANKSKSVFPELLDYLKQKESSKSGEDGSSIIIFWDDISGESRKKDKFFQFLTKQKLVQEFKPLSGTAATEWLREKADKSGVRIQKQAAGALASLCGGDLWRMKGELDKLAAYKKGIAGPLGEAEIELQDVEETVRGVFDENIFALTDAISQRNKGLALELLEKEMDTGVPESYLLHMIERQFRILLQIRQGLDQGLSSRKLISQLKLHPFVVQKCLLQVRNFSLPVLSRLFQKTVSMDKSVKSGKIDVKTAVTLLIAAF